MTGYVACRWPADDPDAVATAARLAQAALALGWSARVERPGWSLWSAPCPGPLRLWRQLDAHTVVVGALFDRTATLRGTVADGRITAGSDFTTLCRQLTADCWGAYVALRIDPDDATRLELFRDPIGMLDCTSWSCGALRIVTSHPEAFLAQARPERLAIDWTRVGALLRFAGAAGEALPIVGVEAIPAGAQELRSATTRETRFHWTPAAFAREDPTAETVPWPALIDACVDAWRQSAHVAIAELSGGLDSAIVAASLARSPPTIAGWFHYHASDPEGDERPYARAVARQLGLPLHETLLDHRQIDAALLADIPVTLRPNVASISVFHDRDLARQGRTLGADMLLTGQGGDALFFQPASALIAADLWRDRRSLAQRAQSVVDLAAWSRQTVWSVLGTGVRAQIARPALRVPDYRVDLLDPAVLHDPCPLHWLADTADLAPAKQLQLLNLASCRASFGSSWCAAVMSVRHPLMSQPLLERVLPLSALALTHARRDRAMIRVAYAGRLPPLLLERRGKGCLTPFYGRMLAASTPFLRDYLLGGVLVRQHLLNRAALAAVLDPDILMQSNVYTEIFVVLLLEHWARAWCDRIASAVSSGG